MTWFLAFVFNGMAFISFEPFQSEEGCVLAAKQANIATFECLQVPDDQESPQ